MNFFSKHNDILKVFTNINDDRENDARIKISIIGCGPLGGACGAALIYRSLPANIILIEPIKEFFGREKSLYHSLDHCSPYKSFFKISYSNDITASANSDICLFCFEHQNSKINRTRESTYYQDNITNLSKYVPEIVKLSPKVILVMLTYPYNALTLMTYKLAKIPKHRIIGVGTSLSTSEFQTIIAKKFNISPKEVEGYVIGLNVFGNKIPLWSTVSVCGIHLNTIIPGLGTDEDPLKLSQDFEKIESKREIYFQQFGPPRWTTALLCSKLCRAIIFNTKEVFTIPTNIKGFYDIRKTCYMSVPCTVGRNGIHSILKLQLNRREVDLLKRSAAASQSILSQLVKRLKKNKEL